MLLISCFVVCVAAQTHPVGLAYDHQILLKPNHYSEIEVDCSQGDLLGIRARSVDKDYFYVKIIDPLGYVGFSEESNESVVGEYRVGVSGVYTIEMGALYSGLTVEYTISKVSSHGIQDIKLPTAQE